MITPASIAYVPPPEFKGAETFLANVRQYALTHPLILFSEHNYEGVIKLKRSPEILKRAPGLNGEANLFAHNNLIFFTAVRLAMDQSITHIFYLESDCRVMGDHWDKVIFEEHFNRPIPVPFSGSIVTYNPCNAGMASAKRWCDLVDSVRAKTGMVPATYGFKGAADPTGTAVFVNGALGVYDLSWIRKLFRLDDQSIGKEAAFSTAWDMELGFRLFKMLGVDAYDMFGWLDSSYSSYGEVMTTLTERLEMLQSGKVRCVHQVKGG